MSIVLDVNVAPFLLAANAIFLARDTSVKKGLSWRGFLNPRSSGRLEELFASCGRIKFRWILIAGLFSLATIGSSFAGEAGISTRIEDRVRGTILAQSQFGDVDLKNEMECDSPLTCRVLRRYLESLVRSGDFTSLNFIFKKSGTQSEDFYVDREEIPLFQTLPTVKPDVGGQQLNVSFQACVVFSSSLVNNTSLARVVAETCGSIEEKHNVDVFVAEPEISDFSLYHPDGQNASQSGWFQAIRENATFVRTTPSAGRVVLFNITSMDLSPYLQKPLPNMCEVADAGDDEEGLRLWVFVCPLEGIDFYVGTLRESAVRPQAMILRAVRLKSNSANLRLRTEDMTGGMSILSPLFLNSEFTGIEGSLFAFRSFVYAVMMSVRASEVQTTKPVVLVVVSIPWLVSAVALLVVPLIIFAAVSYANSLTLPAGIRNTKLDIPHSASQVHKAAIRALYPPSEFKTPWTDYAYALHKPRSLPATLSLGWTARPCALKSHDLSNA